MQQKKPGAANPLLVMYSPQSIESPKQESEKEQVTIPEVHPASDAAPGPRPPKAAESVAIPDPATIKHTDTKPPTATEPEATPAQGAGATEMKPVARAKLHGALRGRLSRSRKKAIVSEDFNRERKLTVMLRPEEDEDLWDLAWAEGLTASSFVREVLVNYLERHKSQVDRARDIRRQLGVQSSTGSAGKDGLAASA